MKEFYKTLQKLEPTEEEKKHLDSLAFNFDYSATRKRYEFEKFKTFDTEDIQNLYLKYLESKEFEAKILEVSRKINCYDKNTNTQVYLFKTVYEGLIA